MVARLRRREGVDAAVEAADFAGLRRALGADLPSFSCISMMNLLDRCDKPMTILRDARELLAPGGVPRLGVHVPVPAAPVPVFRYTPHGIPVR